MPMCRHAIFSFFTPLVPKHDSPSRSKAKIFELKVLLKSPQVRFKLAQILSTVEMNQPLSVASTRVNQYRLATTNTILTARRKSIIFANALRSSSCWLIIVILEK